MRKLLPPLLSLLPYHPRLSAVAGFLPMRGQSLLIFTMKSRSNGFSHFPLCGVILGLEKKKKTYLVKLWLNKILCKSHQRKEAVSTKE